MQPPTIVLRKIPTKRRPLSRQPEYLAQKTICDWLRLYTDLPFFHFAQEGKRSPQYMQFLYDIGFKAGVLDLFLPRGNNKFKGLWIELKTGKNKPTPKQLGFAEDMKKEGYQAVVLWEAWPTIDYIKKFYSM